MKKAIIASGLAKRFTLTGIDTGSHMLLEAEPLFDERTFTSQLLQRGIRVYPLALTVWKAHEGGGCWDLPQWKRG